MNYIGSKKTLLGFLQSSIEQVTDGKCTSFCDIFAGTGIVGSHFKKLGYSIIANDFQYYSYVLNRHYIGNHKEFEFAGLFDIVSGLEEVRLARRKDAVCAYLSDIPPVEGFIYNNYAPTGTKGQEFERMYYSDDNAKKCDAIRQRIEKWKISGNITDDEYFFLLTSLLENIDKHSNTASVYGAFLKKLKKTAQPTFTLTPAELLVNDQDHKVYNKDASELVMDIKADILYLDPPYNQRQYAPNYHMLETIAKYDNPQIKGKTGLRDYSKQKSGYCSRGKVNESFRDLIMKADVKYIFLSYNNEGLMSLEDIREIMSEKGHYGCFTQDYNRYKADTNREYLSNRTVEYLHYVAC